MDDEALPLEPSYARCRADGNADAARSASEAAATAGTRGSEIITGCARPLRVLSCRVSFPLFLIPGATFLLDSRPHARAVSANRALSQSSGRISGRARTMELGTRALRGTARKREGGAPRRRRRRSTMMITTTFK